METHHTACRYAYLLARARVATCALRYVNGRKYTEARDYNFLVFAKFLLCKVEKGVENTLHITLWTDVFSATALINCDLFIGWSV